MCSLMSNKTTIVIMLPINKPHRLDAPFFAPFFFERRPLKFHPYRRGISCAAETDEVIERNQCEYDPS